MLTKRLTPQGGTRSLLLLATTLILVALAYWVGLKGPLLLDDPGNLSDVGDWLNGDRSAWSVITNNRSGPLGRPLSMASFLMDAALWGNSIWHLKLTNLLIHLLIGIVLFALYRRLVARDSMLYRARNWLPLLLTAIWLTLPIQASTVLYAVQRMAMLSTLFTLIALWVYVEARESLEKGRILRGQSLLWLFVPTLTALAALSKENGLLVPLLALVVEAVYFRPAPGARRHHSVTTFFALSVGLPAVIAALILVYAPEKLIGGYAIRDFTVTERLLTQSRILWDYLEAILIPYGPQLGIFHDNVQKSTDLFTPWTTLPAVLTWSLVLLAGWRARHSNPAVAAGIGLFLAGHLMESSIVPLELYFEHRNYLPSVGLLLGIAGLAAAIGHRLSPLTPAFKAALTAAAVAIPLVYLAATHGRAKVWSSPLTLYAQELRHNPNSPRLRSYLAAEAMKAGDTENALTHVNAAERLFTSNEDMAVSLWRLLAYCSGNEKPPPGIYHELSIRATGAISRVAMTAWENASKRIESNDCPGVDARRIIEVGKKWLEQSPQSPETHQVWRTRYYLARLLASQTRFDESAETAQRAWQDSDHNTGVGVLLFQVNASLGNWDACKAVYDDLERSRGGDLKLNRALDSFADALQQQGKLELPTTHINASE